MDLKRNIDPQWNISKLGCSSLVFCTVLCEVFHQKGSICLVFLTSSCGRNFEEIGSRFFQIVEEEEYFFFDMQHMVIIIFLSKTNIWKGRTFTKNALQCKYWPCFLLTTVLLFIYKCHMRYTIDSYQNIAVHASSQIRRMHHVLPGLAIKKWPYDYW